MSGRIQEAERLTRRKEMSYRFLAEVAHGNELWSEQLFDSEDDAVGAGHNSLPIWTIITVAEFINNRETHREMHRFSPFEQGKWDREHRIESRGEDVFFGEIDKIKLYNQGYRT